MAALSMFEKLADGVDLFEGLGLLPPFTVFSKER